MQETGFLLQGRAQATYHALFVSSLFQPFFFLEHTHEKSLSVTKKYPMRQVHREPLFTFVTYSVIR
jgi:hypothetical protein